MNSIIYIKVLFVLLSIILSIILVVFILKKIKLSKNYFSKRMKILEIQNIDSNKSIVLMCCDNITYTIILSNNYGMVLNKKNWWRE